MVWFAPAAGATIASVLASGAATAATVAVANKQYQDYKGSIADRKKQSERMISEMNKKPATRVEADVNLAKLDAKERIRRASKSFGSSSGLGTPQLSQPTLSQRLG